jgi:hypothetical protein
MTSTGDNPHGGPELQKQQDQPPQQGYPPPPYPQQSYPQQSYPPPYPQQPPPQEGHQPPPYPQQGYPQQSYPPPYAQQGAYGTMPPMSPQQLPRQHEAPEEVKQSYIVWLVAIGLALVSLIISVISSAQVSAGAAVATAIVGLILYGVWYLFVMKMRDGQQWARITLLVIGILAFIIFLIGAVASAGLAAAGVGLAGGVNVASIVVGVLEWITVAGAMVLMFRPNANAYFQPRNAYR